MHGLSEEILRVKQIMFIICEDYIPAGKEITSDELNKLLVHKSNPKNRENIENNALRVRTGECYKTYAGYGEKCTPAIFATNSTNKRAWFDSTYDDDIWIIDSTKIPNVKWFKDKHYETTKKAYSNVSRYTKRSYKINTLWYR